MQESPRVVSSRLGLAGGHTYEVAVEHGAYAALKRALVASSPQEVAAEVRASGLTGRSGGAAFLTAEKWARLAPARPAYVVVNGDESEPGCFKDHLLLQADPHQVIEGALLCAWTTGAAFVVIYIRGEMGLAAERVMAAVEDAYRCGLAGTNIAGSGWSCDVVVHPGAGAYVVGEETALLESLEGKRGFPRIKPPWYPAARGYLGAPTIVNNVETVSALPWIVAHGGAAFAALGGANSRGTRLFCVSGQVRRPGVYEVELHGLSFRDLILGAELGGGLQPGRELAAFLPGASFPWFGPEQLDLPLDVDVVAANGSSLGSGVMVADDTACPVRLAWRLVRFFHRESCGQCTPCREGTGWLEKVLARVEAGDGRPADVDLLVDVAGNLAPGPFPRPPSESAPGVAFPYGQSTICPIGPSTAAPVMSLVRLFPDAIRAHIATRACPYA